MNILNKIMFKKIAFILTLLFGLSFLILSFQPIKAVGPGSERGYCHDEVEEWELYSQFSTRFSCEQAGHIWYEPGIDDTPPIITNVTPSNVSWTNQDVILIVYATDEGLGLHDQPYSFDGGNTWSAVNTASFNSNQTVHIVVRDKAGNITSTTYDITQLDEIDPTIVDGETDNESWINGLSIKNPKIFIPILATASFGLILALTIKIIKKRRRL